MDAETILAGHHVVKRDDVDTLIIFLGNSRSIKKYNEVGYPSILHTAAKYGSMKCLSLMIDRGVNVDITDRMGVTPLHSATSSGQIKSLTLLLDHDANVNAADCDGHTALHYAALGGHIEALTLLLDRGANIDAVGNGRRTALYFAVYHSQVDCVRLLLERGANRDIADWKCRKPIDLCDRLDDQELAEEIRDADKIEDLLMSGGGHSTKAAKPRSRCV